MSRIGELGDDRQVRLGARLAEDLQAILAQPLKAVGAGARLEGAAAQHVGAGVAEARAAASVCSRVSTAQGPRIRRKSGCTPPKVTPAIATGWATSP